MHVLFGRGVLFARIVFCSGMYAFRLLVLIELRMLSGSRIVLLPVKVVCVVSFGHNVLFARILFCSVRSALYLRVLFLCGILFGNRI